MRAKGSASAGPDWLMRLERYPFATFVVASLLLASLISPLWYATPDAAAYLSIARRVAEGRPPHAFGSPQPSFPLGYPWLISPLFRIADDPFLLLAISNWLLTICFMLGVYQWMRRMVPAAPALLTLLVMANVNVWNLYRRTLSEVLFLPLLMWTVVVADDVIRNERGPARVLALVLLLVWLGATREIGLVVAAAVALTFFTARRATSLRHPVRAVGAAVALVGTIAVLRPERRAAGINALRAAFAGGNDLTMLLLGLRRRIVEVAQLTVPGMFKGYSDPPAWWDVNLAIGVAVVAVVAAGWYRLAQRHADALVILGPLYFIALILWPYDSAARYLLPLLPLLTACGWYAWAPFGRLRRPMIALTIVAHFSVAIGYWWLIDLPRARACNAARSDVDRLAGNLTSDSESVAAHAIPTCAHLALQLALDRRVEQSTTPDAVWIVAPAEHTSVPGFSIAAVAGDYRLWRRVPPQ